MAKKKEIKKKVKINKVAQDATKQLEEAAEEVTNVLEFRNYQAFKSKSGMSLATKRDYLRVMYDLDQKLKRDTEGFLRIDLDLRDVLRFLYKDDKKNVHKLWFFLSTKNHVVPPLWGKCEIGNGEFNVTFERAKLSDEAYVEIYGETSLDKKIDKKYDRKLETCKKATWVLHTEKKVVDKGKKK